MKRWEYAEIDYGDTQGIAFYGSEVFFTKYGGNRQKVKGDPRILIMQLGLEGWEVISHSFEGGINRQSIREKWVLKRETAGT